MLSQGPIEIIQGSRKQLVVRISKRSDGDPLPLDTISNIITCFPTSDEAGEIMLSKEQGQITVLDPALGKIQIDIAATASAIMTEQVGATMELSLDFGNPDGPDKIQIPNAYSVILTVC